MTPKAKKFLAREIKHLVRDKGLPVKRAVAAAFAIARKKGMKVPARNPLTHGEAISLLSGSQGRSGFASDRKFDHDVRAMALGAATAYARLVEDIGPEDMRSEAGGLHRKLQNQELKMIRDRSARKTAARTLREIRKEKRGGNPSSGSKLREARLRAGQAKTIKMLRPNPLLAIVGNPPGHGKTIDISRIDGAAAAIKRCKDWHKAPAERVRLFAIPDGKKAITRKAVVILGRPFSDNYRVDSKKSAKFGKRGYEHVWRSKPWKLLDPTTEMVHTVAAKPGKRLAGDWLRG